MRNVVLFSVLLLPACGAFGTSPRTAELTACSRPEHSVDAAISVCTQLLKDKTLSREERVFVYFSRARAAMNKQDMAGALRDLDESIKLDPSQAVSFASRGIVRGTMGNLESAISDFSRAIELDPNDWVSFQNRAKAYSDGGDQKRAIEDYSRVIEMGSDGPIPRNGRCWSLAVLGRDLAAAKKDCEEAVRLAPKDGNNLNSLAFVRFRSGDYAGAVEDYTKSLSLNPDAGSSYYMRGRAKAKINDPTASDDIAKGAGYEAGVAKRYAGYGIEPL
ncbi:tetratricopeptide repeat protein [Pseudoxanthomonas sacheonensis]|uniref:Tetratricopeptide (TPR) repeat protein n=1 Tax=Pseudoxanthomonas sacheonensis TaxID=443615 RepID=A0ABU1RQW3_9GAMM|nr:tetratricopeptide repeat protein [Pseudoxanthomonas sacheonensis]MDR6841171.1 tetratricopeptide (TPR) repeat protein [Pseudoxanthomonas sacheonensis]